MGIFHNSNSGSSDSSSSGSGDSSSALKSSPSCVLPPEYAAVGAPIVGGMTLEHLMAIIGGACAALALIVSIFWILKHMFHCSDKGQQKLIMRVLLTPVVFSAFGFVGVAAYVTAPYMDAISKLYEAFATCAIFQFYLLFLTGSESRREQETFFMNKSFTQKGGRVLQGQDSLTYFRRSCGLVFQMPVVAFLITIVVIVCNAILCTTSSPYRIIHILVSVVQTISTGTAVLTIIRFWQRFRSELKPVRGGPKLITLKLLIGITVLQTLVFSILQSAHVLSGNATASFLDLSIGLPNMLVCIEMLIFSPLFLWAFSVGPYRRALQNGYLEGAPERKIHKVSPLAALWAALNISDVVIDILYGLKNLSRKKSYEAVRSDENARYETRYDTRYDSRVPLHKEQSPDSGHSGDYRSSSPYGGQYGAQQSVPLNGGAPPQYPQEVAGQYAQPYASYGDSGRGGR